MFVFYPRTVIRNVVAQFRNFATNSAPRTVSVYLQKAKLIDSIRLSLRTNSSTSLISLLQNPSLDSFVITNALRSAPSADSALSLLECLRSIPHFSHTPYTLHALATILAKSRRIEALKALIDDMNIGKFTNVSHSSSIDQMRWFASARDLDSVLRVWNEWRTSDRKPCTESYNILMGLYIDLGSNREAVHVFGRMIDEGRIPNSRTYTLMIQQLCQSGKLDSAMEVFNTLPLMRVKRTQKQYHILIDGFTRTQQFDGVKSMLDSMQTDGVIPSRAMKSSLKQLKEAGFAHEVEDYLTEMLPDERIRSISYSESDDSEDSEGEAADKLRIKPWFDPRALAGALNQWRQSDILELENAKFVWTTRLVCKVLRNFHSAVTAWGFFHWVACQPGFMHNIYTIQRMITLLARHGEVDLVHDLIKKMQGEKMELPVTTVRLMIEFYGMAKNADAAKNIFLHARSICGPISRLNIVLVYSSMLRALTKCRRNSDTLTLIEEMQGLGMYPDIQTMTGLMWYFAEEEDFMMVQRLFRLVKGWGLKPDAYMLKVLVESYCKSGRVHLAWRMFEEMRNLKVMPDSATKELLVKCLWNEGRRKEAAIVEEMLHEDEQVLSLTSRGHVWTVSSNDLTRVYSIYASALPSAGINVT